MSLLIIAVFVLVSCSVSCGTEDAWNEHVLLFNENPYFNGSLSGYEELLRGLPELYEKIRRSSLVDVIQDQSDGLLFVPARTSFKAFLCQDGYEVKGYSGETMFLCSKKEVDTTHYLKANSLKCQKTSNSCDTKNPSGRLLREPILTGRKRMKSVGDDELNSSEEKNVDNTSDTGYDVFTPNFTKIFSCVRNNTVFSMVVCSKHGIQGFGKFGFECANSRSPTKQACTDCSEENACLSNQYVCGVMLLTYDNDARALGVICCSSTDKNVLVVPMRFITKNGSSASGLIEKKVRSHFQKSSRNTFASIHLNESGEFGFYFVTCPPDYYAQGFNGRLLLCTKQLRKVAVTYDQNIDQECEQSICFPDDTDVSCVSSPSPKFYICENSYMSSVKIPYEQSPCSDSNLFSNNLQNNGFACINDSTSTCSSNSTVCGIIVKRYGISWTIRGLICCYTEEIPKETYSYVKQNEVEIAYFLEKLKIEKHMKIVNESTYESLLFNQKIQENIHPSVVLNEYIGKYYGKRMWIPAEFESTHYPENLVMCPNNTYVRGIQTNYAVGEVFKVLCSEEAPMIINKIPVFGGNVICPNLNFYTDIHTCGPTSTKETFEFCGDGKYWSQVPGLLGKKCHSDPCGNGSAVCGAAITEVFTPALIVCCEAESPSTSYLPSNIDDVDAIKAVLEHLKKNFQIAFNRGTGTLEEVMTYHREKEHLTRTLSYVDMNGYMSRHVNNAMQNGDIITTALLLATKQSNFEYWITNEDYIKRQDIQKMYKAYICPISSFVRGRLPDGVLCSEQVPVLGKTYTKILGSNTTCIMSSYSRVEDLSICYIGTVLAYICSRGYFGGNSLSNVESPRNMCSNGRNCQAGEGNEDAKVCGLLMKHGYSNLSYETAICCKRKKNKA